MIRQRASTAAAAPRAVGVEHERDVLAEQRPRPPARVAALGRLVALAGQHQRQPGRPARPDGDVRALVRAEPGQPEHRPRPGRPSCAGARGRPSRCAPCRPRAAPGSAGAGRARSPPGATPRSVSLSTSPYSPTGLPCTVATVGTARRPATSGPIVVWSWTRSKSAGPIRRSTRARCASSGSDSPSRSYWSSAHGGDEVGRGAVLRSPPRTASPRAPARRARRPGRRPPVPARRSRAAAPTARAAPPSRSAAAASCRAAPRTGGSRPRVLPARSPGGVTRWVGGFPGSRRRAVNRTQPDGSAAHQESASCTARTPGADQATRSASSRSHQERDDARRARSVSPSTSTVTRSAPIRCAAAPRRSRRSRSSLRRGRGPYLDQVGHPAYAVAAGATPARRHAAASRTRPHRGA